MNICTNGMFWCAFELVFGVGFAIIALILVCMMLGFGDTP